MSATRWAGCVFTCGLLVTTGIHAGTEDEDEVRIGAQIEARLAAAPVAAPGVAVTMALAQPPAPEPAPVIAEVIAPRLPDNHEDWLAPSPPQNDGVPFAELAGWIGRKVAILTVGERVHRGTVTAVSAREVTLQVRRTGGTATYTLRREQVLRIDTR